MKVSFYTVGCRLNQAETAVIARSFLEKGHSVVEFDSPADIAVINTCTVTEKGDAETRRAVHRAVRRNPNVKVALIGCQAQTQQSALFALPNVRWVVGTERKLELTEIIGGAAEPAPQLIIPEVSRAEFTMPFAGQNPRRTRANLKIQDGCDYFCSFCEIPYARGRARSRVFENILAEARQLAEIHREIVLTGVNIGTFSSAGKTLLDLVDELGALPKLLRIRISSIEGLTLPRELFSRMQNGKLCRHLHLSIQSAQDDILRRMNRRYTVSQFRALTEEAVSRVPLLCLGTDVIVGFPGETDRQFQETFENLRTMPFAYFHVFSYSDRPHAKSRRLPNKIAAPVIEERSKILRELSAIKRRRFLEGLLGKTLPVLFEQPKNGRWSGLTDNYARVLVQSDRPLHNQLLPVKLKHLDGQKLVGILDD